MDKRDFIIPDWPAPPHVHALITTRAGGVSTGPWSSLKLGFRAGDDADAVRQNRERLAQHLPQPPKWLMQVHGATVVDADVLTDSPAADASIARVTGTVCTIMIADCLPVLFTNHSGSVVAAAHAGWRGLAGGVIANTVSALAAAGAPPETLMAYIGPGIGPNAFEVGADVYTAFTTDDTDAAALFKPHTPGKWMADLVALARRALARAGVTQVFGGGMCTVSDPTRFFSYRRDRTTGRMGAFIWREQ